MIWFAVETADLQNNLKQSSPTTVHPISYENCRTMCELRKIEIDLFPRESARNKSYVSSVFLSSSPGLHIPELKAKRTDKRLLNSVFVVLQFSRHRKHINCSYKTVCSVHHFIILYKLKHVLEVPDYDLKVFQFKSLVFCFVFLSHRCNWNQMSWERQNPSKGS